MNKKINLNDPEVSKVFSSENISKILKQWEYQCQTNKIAPFCLLGTDIKGNLSVQSLMSAEQIKPIIENFLERLNNGVPIHLLKH